MSGSASIASYDPYAFAIPSAPAAASAFALSREAIAVTSVYSLRCMAGITFFTAMPATPNTPQRTLLVISSMDEIAHRLQEEPGLIYERHVPALWQNDELRSLDLALHLARERGIALIVVAYRDQRRHVDGSQLVRIFHRGQIAVDYILAVRAPHGAIQIPRHDAIGDRIVVRVRPLLVEIWEVAFAPRGDHVALRIAVLLIAFALAEQPCFLLLLNLLPQ